MLIFNQNLAKAEESLPFVIEAEDYITYLEDKDLIYASEGVEIEHEEFQLKADVVEIDLAKEVFYAKGNVNLVEAERELKGDLIEYDYNKKEGRVLDGESEVGNLLFRGDEFDLKEQGLIVSGSYLTPCGQDVPYYALQADRVEIYPDDRLVAEGVWLLVRDRKLLPLPRYVALLDGTEIVEEVRSIPEPRVGYNRDDNFYASVDYYHYINQDLTGDVFLKGSTGGRSGFDLDYNYQPTDSFKLGAGLGYREHLGWSGRLALDNELGPIKSDLSYRYYYEDDEDDDYQDDIWEADWDLSTELLGVDLSAEFSEGSEEDELKESYQARKDLADYYLELNYRQGYDFNRIPEAKLGIDNFNLGDGNYLNSSYSVAQLSFSDENLRREKIAIKVNNDAYNLNERIDLSWLLDFNDISYDREDRYRSYQLALGNQIELSESSLLDFNYRFFDEFGSDLIEDDLLTEELIGRRHYFDLELANDFKLGSKLDLSTELSSEHIIYPDVEYTIAALELEADYQLDSLNSLHLGYDYLTDWGRARLEDDERERKNELGFGYQSRSSKDYPFWSGEIETAYDFNDGELSKLDYSLRREFDCLATEVSVKQLERSFDFQLEFKY